MERSIVIDEKAQILNIKFKGDMDNLAMELYRDKVTKLIDNNYYKKVVFDFEEVTYIDSSGIGLILGRYNKIKSYSGELILKQVNKSVSKLLVLTGMDKLVRMEMEVVA